MSPPYKDFRSSSDSAVGTWSRTFDVKEPIMHRKGYTAYKVVSKVYPTVAPEAVTEITVWKRYSDFKKLHKEMMAMHKNLHLKGKFPPFAKSQVFGRFDEEVIEARRKCAKELLDFVAAHPPLFTSSTFTKFFEDDASQQIRIFDEKDILKEKPLVPPPEDVPQQAPEDEYVVIPGRAEQRPHTLDIVTPELPQRLEYRNPDPPVLTLSAPESECPSSQDSSETPETTPVEDPNPAMKKSVSSTFLGGVWRHLREEDTISLSSDDGSVRGISSLSHASSFAGGLENLPDQLPVPGTTVSETSSDEIDSKPENGLKNEFDSGSYRAPVQLDFKSQAGHYIFLAAEIVGSAQEAEAQGDFRTAFVKYKAGIGILLEGVQSDEDPNRRNAVKRKTAHYLERAEQIYETYLASSEELGWEDGVSANFNSTLLHLQEPVIELSRYKVLGLVGPALLVLDATAGRTCVIKVLQKSSASGLWTTSSRTTVVIEKVPHMVELYHFHETPSSIFLVLQHAQGGRLWDYLHRYSESKKFSHLPEHLNRFNESQEGQFHDSCYITTEDPSDCVPKAAGESSSYIDLFRPDSDEDGEKGGDVAKRNKRKPSPSASVASSSSRRQSATGCSSLSLGPVRQRSSSMDFSSPVRQRRRESVDDQLLRSVRVHLSLDYNGEDARGDGSGLSSPELWKWSRIVPEACVRRWGAQIVVAVASLHARGIVCGDLNPCNILLGSGGEVLLSYFSEWSCINKNIPPHLMGSGYIAPEVVAGILTDKVQVARTPGNSSRTRVGACDWWSVGALMYELLTWTKLVDVHPDLTSHQVVLRFPPHLSREACGLLSELLRFNPNERLGTGVTGWEEIRAHSFFAGVDWGEFQRHGEKLK